ncbi:hypothetical protein SMQE32_37530 [Serratia marcescens]|nr:hypothetical protein AF54_01791 [Serratia marcescens BIDMC 81]CAI2533547.1 MltA-interacting protein MipA [Serratia marcescens]CAI2784059.1 MltA-interacting protein MipA [Serratia marcescens]BEL87053.1 hypothetical protein SM12VA4_37140 [Serratia marcescens]BEL96520.1 hypothetical protein SM14BL09_36730 [Serratia marcescens]
MFNVDNKLGTSAAALLFLFPLAGQAQDGEASLTLAGGLAVAPAYEGSSFYSIEPLYQVNAGYQNASWGEFSAGSEGARWQFPIAGPVGIALLLNYDAGRDEEIKTLRGRNTRLKGMGKLGGALEAGAELSYQLDPFRAYVKGMQATRKRSYGGEELGHTAYVESGLTGQYPLSEQLTLIGNLSTTWANSGYQRGYFGVTSQQAQHSAFSAYRPGSGFKDATLTAALNYQWRPNVAFQAGVGVTRLLGDAADSPIVEKTTSGMAFTSASYSF